MSNSSQWIKSSKSGANGGECLELRNNGQLQLRDSKLGEESAILDLSKEDFKAIVELG